MRLLILMLWVGGVFAEYNVFGGWFWPLMGWIFLPRMTMMLAAMWMFPDHGPHSLWVFAVVFAGFADALSGVKKLED